MNQFCCGEPRFGDVMREALYIVVGALFGFVLGGLAPIAFYFVMLWMDPAGMRQGGGTPFAILIILTAPVGAVVGAFYGYRRLHPPTTVAKKGLAEEVARFELHFADFSFEEQQAALAQALPDWLGQFRSEMRYRTVALGVMLLSNVVIYVVPLLVALPYLANTARFVFNARTALETIRRRWGDEPIRQAEPLPYLLR